VVEEKAHGHKTALKAHGRMLRQERQLKTFGDF
jgi:hypothetical protein